MKIELAQSGLHSQHTDVASAVAWTSSGSLVSAGDDHRLLLWNETLDDSQQVLAMKEDWYPTSIDIGTNSKKTQSDVFTVGFDDGKIRFISQSGRLEKTMDAHIGAVTSIRWSADGQAILTAGEDGILKVWSRAGMMRTILAQSGVPIYSASWSSCSTRVVHTASKHLAIVSLKANAKPETWKAHDGVALVVDWSSSMDLIVSGGEDGKYKLLYTGATDSYPITACRWAPSGEMFAIGGYNTLRICDKTGWTHALVKPESGSIYGMQWCSDSTQLAAASATGTVMLGQIVQRYTSSSHHIVTQMTATTLMARSILTNVDEELDFREKIVMMSLLYEHLIVVTTAQCVIYRENNWLSPSTIMLKAPMASVIQSRSCLLLADRTGALQVYSYDGRNISSIKPPNFQPQRLHSSSITISDDTVVLIDHKDGKLLHVFDTQSGRALGKPYTHTLEVASILLDHAGTTLDRCLAFIDKNRDLFIVQIRRSQFRTEKLATMVTNAMWHDRNHMMSVLHESRLDYWLFPSCAFIDAEMLPLMKKEIATPSDLGKAPCLISFSGNLCCVRRADGASTTYGIPPHIGTLQSHAAKNAWEDAIRLCRFIKDDSVWACLAVLATRGKELNAAEIAYAAINAIDKVEFLQRIKNIPTAEGRNAELALFSGQVEEASALFLQSGLIYRLIDLYIRLFDWDTALEIAIKHKTHVDTVLAYRKQYLDKLGRSETKTKFVQYGKSIEIDREAIQAKIDAEIEAERQRPGASPYV